MISFKRFHELPIRQQKTIFLQMRDEIHDLKDSLRYEEENGWRRKEDIINAWLKSAPLYAELKNKNEELQRIVDELSMNCCED